MKRVASITAALACAWLAGATQAQVVYKCSGSSYSEQPCSARVVRTYEAPVPPSPKWRDVVSRRLPGETVAEFGLRKRRVPLAETDRDECARLDKRIALDQERMKSAHEAEVDASQVTLGQSHRRYRELRC